MLELDRVARRFGVLPSDLLGYERTSADAMALNLACVHQADATLAQDVARAAGGGGFPPIPVVIAGMA